MKPRRVRGGVLCRDAGLVAESSAHVAFTFDLSPCDDARLARKRKNMRWLYNTLKPGRQGIVSCTRMHRSTEYSCSDLPKIRPDPANNHFSSSYLFVIFYRSNLVHTQFKCSKSFCAGGHKIILPPEPIYCCRSITQNNSCSSTIPPAAAAVRTGMLCGIN